MELPKIISVDDHVVEPPHVWQTWLPQKYREKGPRIERANWAPFEHKPGAKYTNTMADDGMPGRLLGLRGQGHLRPQAVRRHPSRSDTGWRSGQVRPDRHGDDADDLRRDAAGLLRP